MGYYTRYDLRVLKSILVEAPNSGEVIADLRENNEEANYAVDGNGEAQDDCKWYDSETHMREFSKKYPKLLFELSGYGEEREDFWKRYFKNGLCQVCVGRIEYPAFKALKMK